MSKKAFDKIAAGLREVIKMSKKNKLKRLKGVPGIAGMSSKKLKALRREVIPRFLGALFRMKPQSPNP